MAKSREGFYTQPEQAVMEVRPATRRDYLGTRGHTPTVYGAGEHYGRLHCGHGILRLRRPKVGSCIVCWACASGPHKAAR